MAIGVFAKGGNQCMAELSYSYAVFRPSAGLSALGSVVSLNAGLLSGPGICAEYPAG